MRLPSEDLEKTIKYTSLELSTVVKDICLKVLRISMAVEAVGMEKISKKNIKSKEMRASKSSDV